MKSDYFDYDYHDDYGDHDDYDNDYDFNDDYGTIMMTVGVTYTCWVQSACNTQN